MATHSDKKEFQSEDEELEEDEDMTKGFETMREVAKSANGMAAIATNILKSANACGLSKQEWDQLLIEHCAATNKRLDAYITGDRDIGRCCDLVAKANGLLPSVY
jgi:hypothetical protein